MSSERTLTGAVAGERPPAPAVPTGPNRAERRDEAAKERRRYRAFATAVRQAMPEVKVTGEGARMQITGPAGFRDRHEFKAIAARFNIVMTPVPEPEPENGLTI